mmetsp:Transcript_33853/g.74268  ORF Transcript_33853/g.74268 Transcript_33853/m.74268 type:complete len:94 (-) Transcript_33853:8-289(-)
MCTVDVITKIFKLNAHDTGCGYRSVMRPSSPVETEREGEGGKDNWLLVGHRDDVLEVCDEVQRMGDRGTVQDAVAGSFQVFQVPSEARKRSQR